MIAYSLILNNDDNILAHYTRTLPKGNEKRGTCIVDYDDDGGLCFIDDKSNIINVPKELIISQFNLKDAARNPIVNDVFYGFEDYHYDLKHISNFSNTHELNIDLSFDRMSELESKNLIKIENGLVSLTDLGNKLIENEVPTQKKFNLEDNSTAVTLSFSDGKTIDVMYRDNGEEKAFFDIGWVQEDKEGNNQYEPIDGKFSTVGEAISFAREEYFTQTKTEKQIANNDTVKFVNLMLDEAYVFELVQNDWFDGKDDFIQRNSSRINVMLSQMDTKIDFDIDNIESGWVFVQLELGGLEKVDFGRDFSDILKVDEELFSEPSIKDKMEAIKELNKSKDLDYK